MDAKMTKFYHRPFVWPEKSLSESRLLAILESGKVTLYFYPEEGIDTFGDFLALLLEPGHIADNEHREYSTEVFLSIIFTNDHRVPLGRPFKIVEQRTVPRNFLSE